jgi:hypothetical protein
MSTSNPEPTSPSNMFSLSRREYLTTRQQMALVYSGLLFMFVALCCFGTMIVWLIKQGGIVAYRGGDGGSEIMWYIGGYMPVIILFSSSVVSIAVGYALLSAAGAAAKDVIPKQDYELVSRLIADEKEKGINLYIRLNSLSGVIGFFTKIGITGLPLATIFLSLTFAILGLGSGANPKLLDLANLTLGAFLGSYVQRQVSGGDSTRDKNQVTGGGAAG